MKKRCRDKSARASKIPRRPFLFSRGDKLISLEIIMLARQARPPLSAWFIVRLGGKCTFLARAHTHVRTKPPHKPVLSSSARARMVFLIFAAGTRWMPQTATLLFFQARLFRFRCVHFCSSRYFSCVVVLRCILLRVVFSRPPLPRAVRTRGYSGIVINIHIKTHTHICISTLGFANRNYLSIGPSIWFFFRLNMSKLFRIFFEVYRKFWE